MTNLESPLDKIEGFLSDLADDPKQFYDAGRPFDFLNLLFKYPEYDCLTPILRSEDLYTKRTGIWITSELGGAAKCLAKPVVSLLKDSDRLTVYHAYESLMSMSDAGATTIKYIPSSLTHQDHVIRELGMFLLSNASDKELGEVKQHFLSVKDDAHTIGIDLLLTKPERGLVDQLDSALFDENWLQARYVLIALRRSNLLLDQDLIDRLGNVSDQSLVEFAKTHLES